MNETIQKNISAYTGYYQDQLSLIEEHCPKSSDGDLHRKVLYTAVLDAFSSIIFYEINENRVRFVKFITDFCDWPEYSRISLPHLFRLVKKKSEPDLQLLKTNTGKWILTWKPAEKVLLSRDPDIMEVEQLWPKHQGKTIKIDGIGLDWLQHSNLLYTYRNRLIHEFRQPGRHAEIWDDNEPYYSYLIEYLNDNSNEILKSWELQYTANFFKRLCYAGLSNMQTYLIGEEKDPFKLIDWGNYWIRELNR